MNWMTFFGPSIVSSFFLFVMACSPYIYKEEIGTFKSGVAQASQMLDAHKEFMEKRALTINRADLIDLESPRLIVPSQCAEIIVCMERVAKSTNRGKRCSKKYIDDSNLSTGEKNETLDAYRFLQRLAIKSCGVRTLNGREVEIPTQLPAQQKVLATLSRYASALAGIVNAKDKKALSESASKACASTQKLYSVAVASNSERDDSSEKEDRALSAVCGLVTELGIAILDRRRVKVLKSVVNEADSDVGILASYLKNESRKINSIVLRNELEQLRDSVDGTVGLQGKKKEYLLSVDSAVSQKTKFMDVLNNSPESVFSKLADAHQKLKKAVNDPKNQLEAAIEAMEKFHAAAKDAHEAIKAISDDDSKQ